MLRLRRPLNEALAAVAAGPRADIAYGRTPRSASEVLDGLGLDESQRLALIDRVQDWVSNADQRVTRKLALEGAASIFPDQPRRQEFVRRVLVLGEHEWLKSELVWVLEDDDPLEKGAGHKYLARLPSKNPPPKYRYVYKMPTRKHLVSDEHLREGVKVKVEHKGKAGHIEVQSHDAKRGVITGKHDESGETIHVKAKDLRSWSAKTAGKSREEAKEGPKLKVKTPKEKTPKEKQGKPQKVQTIKPEQISEYQDIVGFFPTADAVDAAKAEDHELAAIPQHKGFLVVRRPKSVKDADGSLHGAKTKIFLRGGSGKGFGELEGEYAAVEADELIASHKAGGSFAAHPKYPKGVQERRYEDLPGEQLKVSRIANNLTPEMLINTNPDGVNGTPVTTDDNVVLGGNGRTMGMQLAYAENPVTSTRLREHLIAHAGEYGLRTADVKAMKRPVLVRRVKAEASELRLLGRRLNQALTQGMDPRTAEVTMGKNFVTPQLLSHLITGMEPKETLADYFHSGRSMAFVKALRAAGIIDDLNVDEYVDKGTGLLNEDGRQMAERVIVARVLPDAKILSSMTQTTRTSLAKAMPYILRAEESGWDLREPLMAAVKADIAYRKDYSGPRRSYLKQQTLGNDETDPLAALHADPMAAMLFQALDRGPRAMPDGFRSFARRAEQASHDRGGFGMFAGEPENPVRAIDRAFGISSESKKLNAEEHKKAQAAQDDLMRQAGLEPPERKKRGRPPKAKVTQEDLAAISPPAEAVAKSMWWGMLSKAWGVKNKHLSHYMLDAVVREVQWMAKQGMKPEDIRKQLPAWLEYEITHDPEMARAFGAKPLSGDAMNGLIEAVGKLNMPSDDLEKSDPKPPGSGWQLIPGGRHGGFRKRRRGGGWEYWYPETGTRFRPYRGEPKHVHDEHANPDLALPEPFVAGIRFGTFEPISTGAGSQGFAESPIVVDGKKIGTIERVKLPEFDPPSSRNRIWKLDHYEVSISEPLPDDFPDEFKTLKEAKDAVLAFLASRKSSPDILKSLLEKSEQLKLFGGAHRGGPYLGPRGGKWADPQHTIPWQEDAPKAPKLTVGKATVPGTIDDVIQTLIPNEKAGTPTKRWQQMTATRYGHLAQLTPKIAAVHGPEKAREVTTGAIVRINASGWFNTSPMAITDSDLKLLHEVEPWLHPDGPAAGRKALLGKKAIRDAGMERDPEPEPAPRFTGKKLKLPKSVVSFFQTDVDELAADPDAHGLDEHEALAYKLLSESRDGDHFRLPSDLAHAEIMRHTLVEMANSAGDQAEYGEGEGVHNKRAIGAAGLALSTLSNKLYLHIVKTKERKPVKKSGFRLTLRKSIATHGARPSGGGWEPIPLGSHGGLRRRKAGGGWDYWYPEGTKLVSIVRRASGKETEIKVNPDGWERLAEAMIVPDLSAEALAAVKKVARFLTAATKRKIRSTYQWREKTATRAMMKTFILNYLYADATGLPKEFTEEQATEAAEKVYDLVSEPGWERMPEKEKAPPKLTVGPRKPAPMPVADTGKRAEGVSASLTESKSKTKRKSDNEMALEIVQRAVGEDRGLTDEEAVMVAKYSGKGGISGDLNSFFTRTDTANAMWDVIAAYQDGLDRVLEPSCGSGVFLATAPKGTKVTGVELDSDSAMISSALFSHKHEVEHKAFEQFSIERMGAQQDFDAVIANPPYCVRTGTADIPPHKPEFKSADQYFIDTSLDHLRDGGTACFLIHPGVINNKGEGWKEFRSRLLARAEVLEAFRLPDDTFKHVHCGISADILVLRKRDRRVGQALMEANRDDQIEPTLTALGAWNEDFVTGHYFDSRQENILGKALTAEETGWRATVEGDILAANKAIRRLTEKDLAERAKAPGVGGVTFEALTALAEENEHVRDCIRQGDAKIAKEDIPPSVGNIRMVGRRRYMYIGEPPKWTSFEGIDDVSQIIDKSGDKAIKEAHEIAEDLADLIAARDAGEFYRSRAMRRAAAVRVKAWVSEYGIPGSHRALGELSKQVPKLLDFMACVNSYGELSDVLSKDAAVTLKSSEVDRSNLLSVVEYIARRNRGFVSIDDIQHNWEGWEGHSDDDLRALVLASGQYALAAEPGQPLETGTLQHIEDYLTGNLYDKLDGMRGRTGEQALAQALAIKERLDTKRRSIDDIPLQLRVMGWMPLDWFSQFLNSPEGRLAVLSRGPRKPGDPEVRMVYDQGVYALQEVVPAEGGTSSERVWDDEAGQYVRREYPPGTVLSSTIDQYLFLKYMNRLNLGQEARAKATDVEENVERAFNEWIKESHLREELEELYNRTFNGEFRREYSGDALGLEGMTEGITPHEFQNEAVRWAAETGRGILGQDVGLGKTFIAILLARLRRQDGTSKRPMVVVPKAVATNWAEEVETLFPGSRVLVIGEHKAKNRNLAKQAKAEAKTLGLEGAAFDQYVEDHSWAVKSDTDLERNQKLAAVKQNDYDLIICTKPAFDRIPLKLETIMEYEEEDYWYERAGQLDQIREKSEKTKSKQSAAQTAEKRREKLKATWTEKERERKFKHADDLVFWEDLGIDTLMADEAHAYKNLYSARSRYGENPKFLGGSGQSKQARKMQHMSRWVRDSRPTNGVYFLTATPTKNSPLEVFNMLQHIAPEAFQDIGIRNSEEFIDRFCEMQQRLRLVPPGREVEKKKKKDDEEGEPQFADEFVGAGNMESSLCVTGFTNLKELEQIMDRYMMLQTATDVGLKIPDANDHMHLVDMTEDQHEVYADLVDQMGDLDKDKDPGGLFRILDLQKKAAQDLELFDPEAFAGWYTKSPKYKACVEEAAKGARERGGQIIFCDHNASHERLKAMLVEQGLRPEEIGIINAQVAPDSGSRQAIGDAFNRGTIKVVIGNTGTMGEGVNLQGKKHEHGTTDIHHLDLPWDPGTMHQRNGRGVRQGNRAEQVQVHTYLSKGSFDGFRYSTLKGKQRWLDKLRSGADTIENDMEGQGGDLEMLAQASRDPEAALAMLSKMKVKAQSAWYAKMAQESVDEFYKYQARLERLRKIKPGTESAQKTKLEVDRLQRQLLRNELLPLELKAIVQAGDSPPLAVSTFMTGEGDAARLAARTVGAGDVIKGKADNKFVVTDVDLSSRKLTVRHWGDSGTVTVEIDEFGTDYLPTKYKAVDELNETLQGTIERNWVAPIESLSHIAGGTIVAHRATVEENMRAWYAKYEDKQLLVRGEGGSVEATTGAALGDRAIVLPWGEDRAAMVKAVADGNPDQENWRYWSNDVARVVERMCGTGNRYTGGPSLYGSIMDDAEAEWKRRKKKAKPAPVAAPPPPPASTPQTAYTF